MNINRTSTLLALLLQNCYLSITCCYAMNNEFYCESDITSNCILRQGTRYNTWNETVNCTDNDITFTVSKSPSESASSSNDSDTKNNLHKSRINSINTSSSEQNFDGNQSNNANDLYEQNIIIGNIASSKNNNNASKSNITTGYIKCLYKGNKTSFVKREYNIDANNREIEPNYNRNVLNEIDTSRTLKNNINTNKYVKSFINDVIKDGRCYDIIWYNEQYTKLCEYVDTISNSTRNKLLNTLELLLEKNDYIKTVFINEELYKISNEEKQAIDDLKIQYEELQLQDKFAKRKQRIETYFDKKKDFCTKTLLINNFRAKSFFDRVKYYLDNMMYEKKMKNGKSFEQIIWNKYGMSKQKYIGNYIDEKYINQNQCNDCNTLINKLISNPALVQEHIMMHMENMNYIEKQWQDVYNNYNGLYNELKSSI